jgi:hypothetical protein
MTSSFFKIREFHLGKEVLLDQLLLQPSVWLEIWLFPLKNQNITVLLLEECGRGYKSLGSHAPDFMGEAEESDGSWQTWVKQQDSSLSQRQTEPHSSSFLAVSATPRNGTAKSPGLWKMSRNRGIHGDRTP